MKLFMKKRYRIVNLFNLLEDLLLSRFLIFVYIIIQLLLHFNT